MVKKLPVPAGLSGDGAALWSEVTGAYELRADELRILRGACQELELIARMDAELDGADLMVRGSQGQPVANPLAQEVRQHWTTYKGLVAQLKLPDEEGREQLARSGKARDAANARWKRGA